MVWTLATWNVNSLKARKEQVLRYLELREPSVICLQETKLKDEAFPSEIFEAKGYQVLHAGGPGRNGVAILTRDPAEKIVRGFSEVGDPQARERLLGAEIRGIYVISVYVPNGSPVGSDYFLYKLEFIYRLREFLERHFTPETPLAICGDFNVAPEPLDVYDPDLLEGQICFHERERSAIKILAGWGLYDALRWKYPESPGLFSWWDYQFGAFRANRGMRLDHIWVTKPLRECLLDCSIDREPRGWKRPSDHAPVIAYFDLFA